MTKSKKSKKTKAKSILSKQKPKRSRKKNRAWKKIAMLSTAGLVLLCVALLISIYEKPEVKITKHFSISLKADGKTPLTDKMADAVLKVASDNLADGSGSDLEKAAKEIQILGSFEHASVLKTGPEKVVISVKRREPLFHVEADRLRYLSTKGAIYGKVEESSAEGSVLIGVFKGKRKYHFAEDRSLIVTKDEKKVLNDAVKLFKAGKSSGFSFDIITHKKYRGFSVHLAKDDVEVLIGRLPYEGKLIKLRKILAQLEKKGSHAERIELDYQGKAFIKTRKM